MRPPWSALIILVVAVLLLPLVAGCSQEKPVFVTSLPAGPTQALPPAVAVGAGVSATSIPLTGVHVFTATPTAVTPATVDPPAATTTPAPAAMWLAPDVPPALARAIVEWTNAQPARLAVAAAPGEALIQISVAAGGTPLATWVYALVAPFSTLVDGVAWADVRGAWTGVPSGPFAGRPLLMTETTLASLKSLLGEPVSGATLVVTPEELLAQAWADTAGWAIVPFDELEPRWKVLRVDGASPLHRGLNLDTYPLVVRLSAAGPVEVLEPLLTGGGLPATNRDEGRMTVVVMTGVTALTRATAWRMEGKGLTYPSEEIGPWLRTADITHVSNEVSFDPECGPPNPVQEGLLFCSDPRYIALLEDIGVDVVEMTGNHIADAGSEHIEPTLDMYVQRGWKYFGGGRNLEDARQPAIFEHNGNTIAFVGCNPVGPPNVWAMPDRAGAAPCDYDLLYAQLAELRAGGVLPIATLQYWEMDQYHPTPQQVADFQALIDAGAVIVSGSHAHHVQGFGFHAGGFIHYGIGNLFFDQMEILGNRQEFIDRHVFYAGRHISTEVLTAMLEDWSRPRPMTEGERTQLLQTVFAVSQW